MLHLFICDNKNKQMQVTSRAPDVFNGGERSLENLAESVGIWASW
jgi:hypothetical protein